MIFLSKQTRVPNSHIIIFEQGKDISDKDERNSLNPECYGPSWTLCLMLNLVLEMFFSTNIFNQVALKKRGKKNPQRRNSLERKHFISVKKDTSVCIKQIFLFSLLLDCLMKAISMPVLSDLLSIICLNHTCNLPTVKYCCFPSYPD